MADYFNRELLAIEIDLNLPAARVVRVLERIAAWRGYDWGRFHTHLEVYGA